jgi:glutathione S-transferase
MCGKCIETMRTEELRVLTIHHLGESQSERIVWLCEELGLDYNFVRYAREPAGMAPPEYKALHPLGTAPIVSDDGLALAESGAIIEYICRKYAGGRLILGPEHPDFIPYLFWFHYANGSMIPAFMMDLVAARMGAEPTLGRTDQGFQLVESRLGEVEWFAGSEFTAADVMMVFILTSARVHLGRELGDAPNLRAYLQRIGVRPAYQAAMAKAEPQREPLLT